MDEFDKVTEYQAVVSLVGHKVSYHGEYVFHDGQTKPTQNEIDAEVIRLQAEYTSQEYARNRKAEYDALNQFELISDDTINGTTTHKDAIVAIKTKYPKG
jgi:hypothetical protein